MFAVPGWSVSQSLLKTQTTSFDSSRQYGKNTSIKPKLSTRKRKHNHFGNNTKDVTSANFANLWEEVIERKYRKKEKSKRIKSRRKEDFKDNTTNELTLSLSQNESLKQRKPNIDGSEFLENFSSQTIDFEDRSDKHSVKAGLNGIQKAKRLKENKEISLAGHDEKKQVETKLESNTELPSKQTSTLTKLQSSMRQKLVSSRFRYLNQALYNAPSSQSLTLFQENPDMFHEYHEGFRRQVEIWPENPVEGYITELEKRGVLSDSMLKKNDEIGEILPLPRTKGTCTVADLGCGDAALSKSLQSQVKELHLKILSFDLQSISKLVTKADIANLPLPNGSIDVAIFCLSLMGTNWIDFIEEAFRILRWKGELWVAEIKSRFGRKSKISSKTTDINNTAQKKLINRSKKVIKEKNKEIDDAVTADEVDRVNDNREDTDLSAFIDVLKKRGFALRSKEGDAIDIKNKMFVKLYFTKNCTPIKGKYVPASKSSVSAIGETWKKSKSKFIDQDNSQEVSCEASVLRPCVYKLR